MTPGPSAAAPAPRPPRISAEGGTGRSHTIHRFARPVFIVAAPCSGASRLLAALARSAHVWTVDCQGQQAVEAAAGLEPADRGRDSNRLTPADANPVAAERFRAAFLERLRDRDGNPPPADATGLRALASTTKNALRVPFLDAVLPRALFVYLHRDPRESRPRMVDAWESRRFVTYPSLPDWPGPPWSMVLTPQWRSLRGRSLAEIVADQWMKATQTLLADLDRLPARRVHAVDHADLAADPKRELERIRDFAGIELEVESGLALPESGPSVAKAASEPAPGRERLTTRLESEMAELVDRARSAVSQGTLGRPPPRRMEGAGNASPLRSVNTSSMPQLLGELGLSLLVSTYQTGRVICVRKAGEGLNTHFRSFETPMGIGWREPRLAIAADSQVCEYQNLPDMCDELEPASEPHDACLIPRRVLYTGDIRVHEVAYAGDELWAVATRFSCLATFDGEHSFVPRWRPRFISELAAEDRCHLNGLAVVDDEVAFVTALGESDEPGGWRENKASGGVVIHVPSSETVAFGLSMPHSPRWHRDRLWLLESGEGTLATIDVEAGRVETVAQLPGFTRGLAFADRYAFVGLSQVREATTFGGLPLTARPEERHCGVWVIDIETGQTVGLLRFEELVQEISDLAILPGMRFPEIAEPGSDAVRRSYVLPVAGPTR